MRLTRLIMNLFTGILKRVKPENRMRVVGLILVITAAVFFLLAPALLVLGIYLDWANFSVFIKMFFREGYFTILPGLLMIGLTMAFFKKEAAALPAKGEKKQKGYRTVDFIFMGVMVGAVVLFILAYGAPPDAFFHRIDTIIPPLGYLAPDLYTFSLWTSLYLVIISAMFLYGASDRTGMDRTRFGSLMMGLLISMSLSLFIVKIPIFNSLEEALVSIRFAWLRNPGTKKHSSGLPYCQAPADISGQKLTAFAPNPPGVRDDIEIIGISNKTIEELRGDWPLDWSIYARLTNLLSNAPNNILLFDISFLDAKGVYGGNYCGSLFNCTPIGENKLRRQVDILADAMRDAHNQVLSDYPMETTDESRSSIANYDDRMEFLRKHYRLRHVHNGSYGKVWVKLPLPPVEEIQKVLDGIGYANVKKDESGFNRWIPVVIRIPNEKRAAMPDYNPDVDDDFFPGIDLMVAAHYYGVDPVEDVEVDWLKGWVKIHNIPQRTIEKLNRETFQMESHDIMARPTSDRTVTIPITQEGLMNINFRGGRYCFKFNEILDTAKMDKDQAAQYFKDKIALVAMYYATGVGTAKDIHLSPYGDMAGIEHHAYAMNTILNQDFARNVPPVVNVLILLAMGLLMGVYLPRVSTWLSFLLTFLLALAYSLVTLFITFDMYSYLHVFPTVILEQVVILVGFIGFRVLTEEENVKFIRNTFSKFVSQDVVEELLANPDAITLGGSKKEVSVFFSDVRGFTTISEALGPEDLVQLLNEYLSEMTELIIDYRGTIDKYMGDAIMAFWGAPVQNDEHAYYACVAALSQYEALKELQKKWSERHIPVLDIGIGINTGPAVVGNMGSSRRMDYTLMGDTVNLGSRLEGITKQYHVKICISEFTYERVKNRVYARELDLVRVKGKLEPVRIYELMGLKDDSDIVKLKQSHQHTQHAP